MASIDRCSNSDALVSLLADSPADSPASSPTGPAAENSSAALGSSSSDVVTHSGSGLVFNNTFGSGATAAFESDVVAAENYLQGIFGNACTVNCTFDVQQLNPNFSGENSFSPIHVSYSTFVSALTQHATTATAKAAAAALANLADPSNGAGFDVSVGEAQILGLVGADSGTDDTIILNSLYWTPSALQTDPSDAEAALEHELSEGIMGRIGGLGKANFGTSWAPMDLFRFTASGQRDFTGGQDGQPTYFSVDGSNVETGLQYHNSINSSGQFDGFDLADWDGVGDDSNDHDPFGPGGPGVGDPGTLSPTDITIMEALGWAPPTPTTTKYINGTYTTGYYLNPTYTTLVIGPAAYVGGAGVTTTATQPSTIDNLGTVYGTPNGITLADGGTVTNESTGTISAYGFPGNGIYVTGGSGTVKNLGLIKGDQGFGVELANGGTITNGSSSNTSASITDYSGVAINGSSGVITNFATITGTANLGAGLGAGGRITNGSATDTTALIQGYDIGIRTDGGVATIINFGTIKRTRTTNPSNEPVAGIDMVQGGTITNGSASDPSALIEGANPIVVNNGAGTITNWAKIDSDVVVSSLGNGYYSRGTSDSIEMTAGGTVINEATGQITNGVSIAGGVGKVINNGSIGGPFSDIYSVYQFDYSNGGTTASIVLGAGGTVTNGSSSNTAAEISNGVQVSGGAGTVTNFGTIGGPISYFSDIAYSSSSVGDSIVLQSGGTVTNGSATSTAADIANGIEVYGAAGKVTNFGTIGNPASYSYGYASPNGYSIVLAAGGSVTNGSATSTAAEITSGIEISGPGTVTNFGTIAANVSTGTAILFNSASDKLIEEGSGVLTGNVLGGGGTLELGAKGGAGSLGGLGSTITGFAKVLVDAGASWTLTGTSTVAAGTTLVNTGTLTNSGTLANNGTLINNHTLDLLGQVLNKGSITNHGTLIFDGDVSVLNDPSVTAAAFASSGLIEKVAGTGTSIIRTADASLIDSGTIDVETGTVKLISKALSIAGVIEGAGTIELSSTGAVLHTGTAIKTGGLVIDGPGAHVTLAESLGYTNAFSAGPTTELTIGSGDLLQLTGAAHFLNDTVDGTGRLLTKGTTSLAGTTLGGLAEWLNTGTLTETGQFTIGDASGHKAVFFNEAGGVFGIAGTVGIGVGTSPASIFDNAGLLEKTAGALSSIATALANTGTVEVASGTLDLERAVTGSGTLKIDSGKILEADAAVGSGQTVDFLGTGDRLVLGDAAQFGGKLSGFATADKLDLTEFGTVTSLHFVENSGHTAGTLTVADNALTAHIQLLGDYSGNVFHAGSDGHGGSFITFT